MIKVHISGHLKDYTGKSVDLEIEGAKDILGVVVQLDERFPSFKDRILDEHDRTRPFINLYLNEENVRDLEGESTRVRDGDVIYILPSVAGGKGGKIMIMMMFAGGASLEG